MAQTMAVRLLFLISCLWLKVDGGSCPALYQRFSKDHTFCRPPNGSCMIQKNTVSASDRTAILNAHNTLRSRVATGGETTYSLPAASNMLQIVWDDELAKVAQKHADQCSFKHDCNECREVKNFGVGQNLAQVTKSPNAVTPDWDGVVKSWYKEVSDFDKGQIDGFIDGEGPPATGHFTQVVWAETWRVGCGFSTYKTSGGSYEALYTCNYGPGGNMQKGAIYKKGNSCSACPVNSCCGNACSAPSYPGLCKISGDNAPQYNTPRSPIFFCGFNNEPSCKSTPSGDGRWEISKTLSGSYIGIALNGGQSSKLSFTTPFKASQSAMCVTIYYRKGPQVDGQENVSTAGATVSLTQQTFQHTFQLKSVSKSFTKMSITLSWNSETKLTMEFSVPAGKPPQYMEFKDVEVTDGKC